MKSKYISLSLSAISLAVLSSISYANQICIKSDTYYRINYKPGTTGTIVNPGENLVNAKVGDKLFSWGGVDLNASVPSLTDKQALNISQNKLTVSASSGSCSGSVGPTPPPTPPKPGMEGSPALPANFVLSKASDSDSKKPSLGKQYEEIKYQLWWGYNAHYMDVYQDGQLLCLSAAGGTSAATNCKHSYVFSGYNHGSQQAQQADLEFGPTTITKHKYKLVLTNDTGQTEKTYDIDLSGSSEKNSVIGLTVDQGSSKYAVADSSTKQVSTVSIDQSKKQITFNLTENSKPLNTPLKLDWSDPSIFSNNPPNSTDDKGQFTVTVKSGMGGRRSSLRITDPSTGVVRYVGFAVLNSDFVTNPKKLNAKERLNDAFPSYVAIGSMTEDNSGAVNYWRHFDSTNLDTNRRVDMRYIYLNQWSNGNEGGWASRESNFLKYGLQLGQMPVFVEYNVNGGQDSQQHVYDNLQDKDFMGKYFSHLAQAAMIAHREAGNTPVTFIIEPDMLGYMLHDLKKPVDMPAAGISSIYSIDAPIDESTVNVPYSQQQHLPKEGKLVDKSQHNFPNTLQGFVNAVNYILWKYSGGTAVTGWQMNLWASPDNSGSGIIHQDRKTVVSNAKALAQLGQKLGIRTPLRSPEAWDNSFISIDKYGLDGAGTSADAATKPVESSWFWNANLYDNYLAFSSNLAYPNMQGVSNLPILLWQIPVGHLNGDTKVSPYTGAQFEKLKNVATLWEGSSAPYFLGESFTIGGNNGTSDEETTCKVSGVKMPYFACPDNENHVKVSGSSVTWGSHMDLAAQSHVAAILFGAGVGASTHGHPLTANTRVDNKTTDPDTAADTPDGNWFISQVQQYYKQPVARLK